MRTGRIAILGVACVGMAGCFMPVGVERKADTSSPPRRRPSAAASEPGNHLVIQGETIRAEDMWRELREELQGRAQHLRPDEFEAYVEQRAVRWINDKVADALLYHQAAMRIAPEMEGRIDRYIDGEIRKRITSDFDGVERRFVRHLEAQGRTLAEERARLRREIVISNHLDQEIRPKIVEPTRAEMVAMYQGDRDVRAGASRRRMSLIDVRVLDRLPENVDAPTRDELNAARAEARSTILAAQGELRTGTPFAEVARRYSDGLHAADGGAWGWVAQGSVRRRFEPAVEALYQLPAGGVSDIIETEEGFFLVQCDEIEESATVPFESVQPELKERHFRARYAALIGDLVLELREGAQIDTAQLERFHAAVVSRTLEQMDAAN